MEALSYVDTLVKEYLLFRGFTRSLQVVWPVISYGIEVYPEFAADAHSRAVCSAAYQKYSCQIH